MKMVFENNSAGSRACTCSASKRQQIRVYTQSADIQVPEITRFEVLQVKTCSFRY